MTDPVEAYPLTWPGHYDPLGHRPKVSAMRPLLKARNHIRAFVVFGYRIDRTQRARLRAAVIQMHAKRYE